MSTKTEFKLLLPMYPVSRTYVQWQEATLPCPVTMILWCDPNRCIPNRSQNRIGTPLLIYIT